MSKLTLFAKVEEKSRKQLKKSILVFLEEMFTITFKGSMPTPIECNQFSRKELSQVYQLENLHVIELCHEHYSEKEAEQELEVVMDLLMPLAYFKSYASKHMAWSRLKRSYKGINMFKGMSYLFPENEVNEKALMEEMKCHPVKENFDYASDEEMEYLCELCNLHDYELINSESLDLVIVEVLIKELEQGKIPQERLRGMYPANMFLRSVEVDIEECIFYID